MSLAAELLKRLHDAAGPLVLSPHAALLVRRPAGAVVDATDMVAAAQATVALIVATEEAAAALDTAAKTLREVLAEVMDESGAPAIQTDHHTASVSAGKASVAITDETLIPPTLMRQPPPAPDKTQISKLLQAGQAVPGAALRNGAPTLTIRSRRTA